GSNEANGFAPTNPLLLPGQAPQPAWSCFAGYPQGYGTNVPLELTNNPLAFNYWQPKGWATVPMDDRIFPPLNMKKLLYYGAMGTDAMTSDIGQLCPQNINNASDPMQRIRQLITTHSYDLDRPGVMPWIWDPTVAPYTLAGPYPTGAAMPFPPVANRNGAVPP